MQAGSIIASPAASAGSLTIATTAAPGGADGSVQIAGGIDFISIPTGGTVTINAGGYVAITGSLGHIAVIGGAVGSSGGVINILALGAVTLNGQTPCLDVHGDAAAGGTVSVQSATSTVGIATSITANGLWQGGQVTLAAATYLTTSAEIDAHVT